MFFKLWFVVEVTAVDSADGRTKLTDAHLDGDGSLLSRYSTKVVGLILNCNVVPSN
jgi:hypothetical protein